MDGGVRADKITEHYASFHPRNFPLTVYQYMHFRKKKEKNAKHHKVKPCEPAVESA